MLRLGGVVLLLSARAVLCCPNDNWMAMGEGDCYLPLPPSIYNATADDGVYMCQQLEPTANFPEIDDAEDEIKVQELNGGHEIWLGLRRASSSSPWVWPSGNAVIYTKWASGQPSDGDLNCATMQTDGKWYNKYCGNEDAVAVVICYCKTE